MKNFYRKISSVLIISFLATVLISCKIKNENSLNQLKVSNDTNTYETKNKINEISPIKDEEWFKNGIHTIRNNITNTFMIVNGNGDIIIKSIEPELESIGTVRDIEKDVVNYVYKAYMGESIVRSTFSGIDYEYIDMNPSSRCKIFDKNGNDIGFEAKVYSPQYSSKNKIIYSEANRDEINSKLNVFDVNTKEVSKLNYSIVYVLNGKFIFSNSSYGEENDIQEVLVTDGDLNEIKKIDGYSIDFVVNEDGVEYAILRKKIGNTNDDSNNYKYNFLNSNFELMLDDDVDENVWTSNRKILTLRVGNKVFDYDVINNERVGEERDYKKTEDTEQMKQMAMEKQYEPLMKKIKEENIIDGKEKYSYIDLLTYNDKVLILASVDKEDNSYDKNPIDVFNTEGKLIASFENLSTRFENQGILISNNDTIYDIDLNEVTKLNNKRNIDEYDKFGKKFFADSMDENYNYVDSFTVFDEKFKPIFENVINAKFDSYDNYIVIVDKDGTKIVDKDLNIVKTIDRKLEIDTWYDNKTNLREFTDLDTKRMGLIDENYNYIIDNLKYIGYKEEKYMNYQNGFEYGIMDYEGRPILKYSIFDSMTEDSVISDYKGNFIEY